jgi:TatD DNase family protein
MLVDTHCHLDFPDFDTDRDEVVARAKAAGLGYIINVGASVEGSRKSLELARAYECVYAVAGIHPHEADGIDKNAADTIKALAARDKVVAIGEIGLDYYKNFSSQENQRALFRSLLALAKELRLPVVLHSRQAEDDTLRIVAEFMPLCCVVHCFSGDENFLKKCLELGFLISFTCNITYKKAEGLRNIVRIAPLDKIMLETDAPYLSPEGFRGKRNEPARVNLLAEEVAGIKGLSPEEIAGVTTENAKKFFNLK